MNNFITLLGISFLFLSCTYEKVLPDLCVDCTFSVKLNAQNWHGEPHFSSFVSLQEGEDTSFFLSIHEVQPEHDIFPDHLVFYQIPYDTGIFVIDTFDLIDNSGIKIDFKVYEYELGTATQHYYTIPDGESYIHIEYLDKRTMKFRLSFHLNMSVVGGEAGPLYNSSYPRLIYLSEGKAEGIIRYE